MLDTLCSCSSIPAILIGGRRHRDSGYNLLEKALSCAAPQALFLGEDQSVGKHRVSQMLDIIRQHIVAPAQGLDPRALAREIPWGLPRNAEIRFGG